MASLKAFIGSAHKELLRNKGKKGNQILNNLNSIKVSFLWEPSLKLHGMFSAFPFSPHSIVLKSPGDWLFPSLDQKFLMGRGHTLLLSEYQV